MLRGLLQRSNDGHYERLLPAIFLNKVIKKSVISFSRVSVSLEIRAATRMGWVR